MRVALVGTPERLDGCVFDAPAGGTEPLRAADAAAVRELSPDVVVAFDPPYGLREELARLGVPALLWGGGPAAGPAQRVVGERDGWRALGLPVADALFADPAGGDGAAAWLGPESERRRLYLSAFEQGVPFADGGAVAVNLRDAEPADVWHRAACALAAGRLLVSETLEPARGLEPGVDYLEGRDLGDVFVAVENAARNPRAFRRVRLRGRRAAERFRASRVIPRLAGDLLRDLR